MKFTYSIPTKIIFGAGSFNDVATVPLPGTKALIVLTAGKSMKSGGWLEKLTAMLTARGIAHVIFDKILSNPVLRHVMEGAALAKAEDCDFVIGIGGGSAQDSAKSIALMAKNPGDYWDYVHGGTGKGQPLPAGALPIVCINTTAGTGTEADPWTVITKEETNEKIGFGCEDTFPTLSIVDPEMMLSIPSHLTAFQGFDALFHATEGYIARVATPVSDAFALQSISILSQWLPAAVRDGNNLEARTQVALAALLSGMVESTSSCTSAHSMEHALSAYYPELPHGAGLIMLSEPYYLFFADKCPQRLADMARAMGVDVGRLPAKEQAQAFVVALVGLQKACNVRGVRMTDYGITREDMPKCAQNARTTMGGLFDADRYALSLEETVSIMENAWR